MKDATLSAQHESWKSTLAYYAVLKRAAETDANLAARLAPVQAYFSNRSRRGKAKAPAATDAAPAPSAEVSPNPIQ